VPVDDRRDEALDLGRIRDIAFVGGGTVADSRRRFPHQRPGNVGERDDGAGFTQRLRAGETDPALRAGDERDATREDSGGYCTFPRAATGQRPTNPLDSKTETKLARLIAGQMWFGTIASRSPTWT
jgi:hypothetical protein